MRPASDKQKPMKNTKQEESTVSTDDNRPNDSCIRLINSEHLTIEMAVGYLFKWRKNSKIIPLLLERIQKFEMGKIIHYIPTIMYIFRNNLDLSWVYLLKMTFTDFHNNLLTNPYQFIWLFGGPSPHICHRERKMVKSSRTNWILHFWKNKSTHNWKNLMRNR